MTDLFDYAKSKEARDAGMKQAEDNADDTWKFLADVCVKEVAQRQRFLTSDDVWRLLKDFPGTHEPRALGPVMTRAKRLGIIEATSEFRNSERVATHASPKRVWHSLIFGFEQ